MSLRYENFFSLWNSIRKFLFFMELNQLIQYLSRKSVVIQRRIKYAIFLQFFLISALILTYIAFRGLAAMMSRQYYALKSPFLRYRNAVVSIER